MRRYWPTEPKKNKRKRTLLLKKKKKADLNGERSRLKAFHNGVDFLLIPWEEYGQEK